MSDYYKTACPQCRQHVEFPAHGVGQTIECPACGNPFTLVAPGPSTIIKPAPPEARAQQRSWRDDPASAKQLNYLRQFGHVSERPMTKGEASELIESFEGNPERIAVRDATWRQAQEVAAEAYNDNTAWVLHEELNTARRELESADKADRADARANVKDCVRYRMDFWRSTFSASDSDFSCQCLDFWDEFGRHFKKPTARQIGVILEALDDHKPDWDNVAPQSFFLTLRETFPELLR